MRKIPLSLILSALLASPLPARDIDDITLRDARREREIPVKVYSPPGPGKHPVIVFSHGLGGSRDGYAYLATHWASQGYVVLLPTHHGSDTAIIRKGRPLRNLIAMKKAIRDRENFLSRPRDISFVLDWLPQLETAVPALAGRVDTGRVGVGGHSFGAYTTIAVAGAKVHDGNEALAPLGDPRPRAFVALSPQGEGDLGFRKNSWDGLGRPIFLMSGTQDKGFSGEPAEWRREAYRRMPAGNKYEAILRGADHFTFAGMGRAAGEGLLAPIKVLTTAFWDAHLKDTTTARARLEPGAVAKAFGGAVTLESK